MNCIAKFWLNNFLIFHIPLLIRSFCLNLVNTVSFFNLNQRISVVTHTPLFGERLWMISDDDDDADFNSNLGNHERLLKNTIFDYSSYLFCVLSKVILLFWCLGLLNEKNLDPCCVELSRIFARILKFPNEGSATLLAPTNLILVKWNHHLKQWFCKLKKNACCLNWVKNWRNPFLRKIKRKSAWRR